LVVVLLSAAATASTEPAVALENDNRMRAGVVRDGVLTLELEIALVRWFPDADDGPSLLVYAFGERGKAPQIPGPLVRASEGNEVQASVRNTLPQTMYVGGLCQRPCKQRTALQIPPGEIRKVRFRVGAPGTYYYWAASIPTDPALLDREDLLPTGIQTVPGCRPTTACS
jgi:FtsP/CotA-like multicopper oxidase with cupredoxin domain